MCDIFEENNGNEELEFANKEWNKHNNSLEKDGFRDGISEGREASLQHFFNKGYELSFGPFLTIATLEAITDVLSFKLGSDEGKQELTQLKAIKTHLKELYHLINNQLIRVETKDLNNILFTTEIIDLFNKTKCNLINICNQLKHESIVSEISSLSLLEINC